MKKLLTIAATLGLLSAASLAVQASPREDLKEFRAYFAERFPDVPFKEYVNGVYAIDQGSREQWEAIEEFPPYELNIDNGKKAFNTPFKNGKTYASCFRNDGDGIKQDYPYYDSATGNVVTLEAAINECRSNNGEDPLKWQKGEIADISAYMAYTSRGNKTNVVVPGDEGAVAAYTRGKNHFYAKRGQLNMSCADCHQWNAGNRIRADLLSPALGHTTHFPVYRSKWGGLGTMHRRYGGCNKQVRAKPFKPQSDEYQALEYFHTYMSNGLVMNGPG
ncbi:MAG: sulfur oxidation c-type cytochrome SoxA, partial [Thiogranum sp.]